MHQQYHHRTPHHHTDQGRGKNVIQNFNHAMSSGISIGSSAESGVGGGSTAGQHLVLPRVMEHQLQLHTIPFLIFLISGCPGLRGWLEPTAEGERWYSDGVCVYVKPDSHTGSPVM